MSLFASPYKFGAPECVLGSWFGSNFGPCFGPHFWARDFVYNCRCPKRCSKMGPKTGTKIGPKSRPQNAVWSPKFVRRREQRRADRIFYSVICLAILFNCATNQQLQPKKEKMCGQNCSNREHVYLYRQNLVMTWHVLPAEDTQWSFTYKKIN